MKPALTTIQKVCKAGKILSRIVFVLCIVCACLMAFALVFYIVLGDRHLSIGGVSIYGLIQQETGISISPELMIAALACCVAICIAEVILSQFAVTYFKHELADGTPFTYHGAKELKRLGFLAMFIPLGVSFAAGIVLSAVAMSSMGMGLNDIKGFRLTIGTDGSFGIGIAMLIISAFCRHGAQMEESRQWPAGGPQGYAGQQYDQQWNNPQGYANQQWDPNQQWMQQNQMNQQWANQQAQANQQWANQQAQANQQWTSQQDPKDQQ